MTSNNLGLIVVDSSGDRDELPRISRWQVSFQEGRHKRRSASCGAGQLMKACRSCNINASVSKVRVCSIVVVTSQGVYSARAALESAGGKTNLIDLQDNDLCGTNRT